MFNDGRPLHDALTIAYVAHLELFRLTRHRVDIELTGTHSIGETIVDIWKYRPCDDTWGRNGRNCNVVDYMDVGSTHSDITFLCHRILQYIPGSSFLRDKAMPLNQ